MRHALHALLMLSLLAAPAAAAKLKLKDGTRIDCTVRSYDTATQTLYVTLPDGKETSYTMAQLDGRTVYQVNSSLVPPDDARAQLLTANFARDAGLFAHAARRYRAAVKLEPGLKAEVDAEMARLRRTAAQGCMSNALAAVGKNDIPEAEKWLKTLVEKLPEEPEALKASEMLEKHYAKVREAKMAKAESKAAESLKRDAVTGRKRFDEMVEKTKKGLQARGNSQAESLFRGALSDGKAVLKELDKLEKKYPGPEVVEQVGEYRKVVNEQMLDVHLHMASQLATQSDYKGAQREVNLALAIDPRNEAALSMRARIEEYASNGLGWRWS